MKGKLKRGKDFRGLIRYFFEGAKHEHVVKNAVVVGTNLAWPDKTPDAAAAEMRAVADMRRDIEKPVLHAVLSLTGGERLSDERWSELIRAYLGEMGLDPELHQFFAVRHSDTDHEHVHIAVNRVGLNGAVWLGKFEAERSAQATAKLEKTFGLVVTESLADARAKRAAGKSATAPKTEIEQREVEALRKAGATPAEIESRASGERRLLVRDLVRDAVREYEALVKAAGRHRAGAQALRDSLGLARFTELLTARGLELAPNGNSGAVTGAAFVYVGNDPALRRGEAFPGSKLGNDIKWNALARAIGYDAERDAALVAQLRARRNASMAQSVTQALSALEARGVNDLADAGLHELFLRGNVADEEQVAAIEADIRAHAPDPSLAQAAIVKLRAELRDLNDESGAGDEGGEPAAYTTQDRLQQERTLVVAARMLAGDRHHDLAAADVADAIGAVEAAMSEAADAAVHFTPAQREAVAHLSRGGLTMLQASASDGPVPALAALREAYGARGYRFLVTSETKRGALRMAADIGIDPDDAGTGRAAQVRSLLADIRHERIKLGVRDVLVIDGAARLDVAELSKLLRHAEVAGAKVVMTGSVDADIDAERHRSGLRLLLRPGGLGQYEHRVHSMSTAMMERPQWFRDALREFRTATPQSLESGLAAFESRGLVRWESGGRDAVRQALIDEWTAFERANPDQAALIVANGTEGALAMSREARESLKRAGVITGPEYRLAGVCGGRSVELDIACGDRVRFNASSGTHGGPVVSAGEVGTVLAVSRIETGGREDYALTVRVEDGTRDGRLVQFRASEYSDEDGRARLAPAFAMTPAMSQRSVVPGHAFSMHDPAMGRAETYVALSRGAAGAKLYVDRDAYTLLAQSERDEDLRRALLGTMGRERGQSLALEYLLARRPEYDIPAPTREARDAVVAKLQTEAAVDAVKLGPTTHEEMRALAVERLFGVEAVITRDRWAEVMVELEEEFPALAPGVQLELEERYRTVIRKSDEGEGRDLVTLHDILEREETLIRRAQDLSHDTHHDIADATIDAAIRAEEDSAGFAFSDEQREAIRHGGKAGLVVLQGSAGAGKSASMAVVRRIYEDESGYRVIGTAVAKKAAENLSREAGIRESYTLAKLLVELERGKLELDDRTCVVVDEAGQVSSQQLSRLLAHCHEAGTKVVLTGEDRQLDAIAHGGALRFLSRDEVVGTARIQGIRRQRESWARDMVADMRDGRMAAGLNALHEHGLLNLVRGGEDGVHKRLIADWRDYRAQHSDKHALIIAHTNVAARELGERVRGILKAEGAVGAQDFEFKGVHGERTYALSLATGDRIRFTKNDDDIGRQGVINGTLGAVTAITPVTGDDGKPDFALVVQTDDRGELRFRASEYSDERGRLQLAQAYATTIYSSQGLSIDGDVFVAHSAGMDRANTYVACSRAKDATRVYVDREALEAGARRTRRDPFSQLVAMTSRESGKELATELKAATDPGYLEAMLARPRTNGLGTAVAPHEARDQRARRFENSGTRHRKHEPAPTLMPPQMPPQRPGAESAHTGAQRAPRAR